MRRAATVITAYMWAGYVTTAVLYYTALARPVDLEGYMLEILAWPVTWYQIATSVHNDED